MNRCYSNSDYKHRGYQHNGDQDRGKSSEAVPSEGLQNGGFGSRPQSTYRTSSTDSNGHRSGFRNRSDDGRPTSRRADNDNVWNNESSHWNQQAENGHRPTPRFREATDQSGNSSLQENNHESREKSSRNDRGGGSYPRRHNDNDYNKSGNVELGRDGYVREIPPRFRSNVGSGENDRRSESGGESERKYNSRQFYPRDDSRATSTNERSNDRGNGDWKRDNHKAWNGDSRKTDNYERRPRKYSNSNDENSKPKNSWVSPNQETKILKKPELGQCSVEIGDYKKISVTYVVDPDNFYCNLFDHASNDRYLEMSEKLNTKCRDGYSLQNMSSCSVGALCCACFSVDEQWYRARVVSVSGNDAEVFFIDYGNSDQCQVSSLKILTDEFQALPARAIKCSLCDIRSASGNQWTADEAMHFENEVTQAIFLGHFKSKEASSGALVVDLIDSSILNDLSLRYKLMAERDFRPKSETDSVYMEAASRSLHLNPYPKIKFNFGQAFTAYVKWINTPGEFYGQLVEKEALWQDFELKLNSFYESKEENELVLSEHGRGTPCIAPYTISGCKSWYRAFIIVEDAEQSLVHYVDYGNTGLVAASEMKLVDPEFLDHPAQAILFSVNGIRPLGSQWEKVSQEHLAKYYSGDLECTVVKCTDDKVIVDVVARGKNVATELTNGGFACPGDDFTLTVAPLIKKLACKLMSVEPEPLDHTLSPIEKFKAPAGTCSQSTFEVGIFEAEPGPSTSAIPSTSSERLPVSAKAQAKELCVGDCFMALVSVVNAANDFWIQHISKVDDIDNLSAILLATYNDTDPEEMLNLSPGDMCVARYSVDGNWYRAKVLGERDFGLTLLFVDYGNVDWVSLDAIRAMPQPSIEWVSEAPYAFACSLVGLPSFQNDVCPENVNVSFNTVLESGNHVVEVTITKRIGDKLCVVLKCQGVDVATVVAEECDLSLVPVEPSVTQFPVPEYRLKTILNGSISNWESPFKFWIQATDDAEKLAQLFEDLTACSESAGVLSSQNLTSGSVVLACYQVDDCWYRAVVNEVSEASANIKFVDYGNSDDVKLDSLKTLPERFIKVPLMAIECTLHGVKRPEQGWSTDELNLFQSLEAQGIVLQLEIVDIVDGVYSVVLRNDDNNYNEILSSQQQPTEPLDITVNVSTPTLQLGMVDYKLGEKVEAFISHIISPSEFWIQKSSDLDKIDNVSDELNGSCVAATGGHSSEIKFNVGEVCAVQFSMDDSWYRGQLLEEKDDGFLVHFVDFGNCEVVSMERMLKLDKFELMNLPFYAIKCELSGGDSCSEWPEETIETFKSVYDNKTCLAEFVLKKPQSYVIHLLDMGIDVAKKLLGDKWSQSGTEPNPDSSSEVQNSVEVILVESEESASSSTGLYSTEVSSRLEEQIEESEDQEAEVSSRSGEQIDESNDQEADLSEVVSNVEEGAEVNKDDVATEIESKSEDQEADLSEVVSSVEEGANVNKEDVSTEIEPISENNSTNDTSKDVSTEGFTSHLTIPTYSEFAEYAASHPGSVAQSPDSSMDRGNGSSNEEDIITSTDVESSSDANSNGQQQWEVSSSTDAESKSFQEDPDLSTTGDAAKAISLIERSTEVSETTDFETEDASSCVDTDGDKSGQPISDDAESAEGVFTGIPQLSITAVVEEETDCSSGQAAEASAAEVKDEEDGKKSGLPEAILEAALLVPLQGDNSWSEGESDDSATIKNSSFEVDSKDGKMATNSIPSTETNAD